MLKSHMKLDYNQKELTDVLIETSAHFQKKTKHLRRLNHFRNVETASLVRISCSGAIKHTDLYIFN